MKPIRFSEEVLTALEKSKGLRIRAGTGTHRFIGIWFVVVEGRVVVRSWSIKPTGWYRKFLRDPRGAIQLGKSEIAIRAVPVRGKTLRDAVDQAYLERYSTPGSLKYAKDLCQARSEATTTELIPMKAED
jgi:hypothetical protein